MKKLLILLAVFSTYAFADNWDQYSKRGVIIRPLENASAPLEYKAGDSAIFEGDICAVSEGHLKNGKEECKKLNGNLEIRAFFPNPTVEITNQIKITKRFNSYYYSFKTPPLKAGDSNTLTLIVGPLNNHLKDLLKTKAKLDHQIDFINKRILKYNLSNKSKKHISPLKFILQKLVSVANKINVAIGKEPLVITKFSRPLQVETDRPAPYYYHSTFDGQRLVLSIPEGLPRIDEKLTFKAEITNLSFKETTKKAKDEKYKAKLYIDGILSHETHDFSNSVGKNFAFSHSSSNHQEGKSREVRMELYSLLKSSSSKGKNSKPNYKLVGSIELPLPKPLKRRDQIPPVIALDLQDNLKINDNKLLLSGTITDVSDINYSLFLNNQLLLESESKLVEHELSLNQGQNILKIIAQDIWGNSAEVMKTISVDSILPIISTTQNYNKLTNQASLQINAQIFDQNQVISKIFHNGHEVHSTDLKEIAFAVNLIEGSNTIKIESIDGFGNIALPLEISGIVLDTVPPVIAFSHSPTIPNPDQEITVDASASSDLSGIKSYSVHSTGTLLASSTSSILKFKIQSSGDHQITLSAEDNAGNLSSFKKTIHINVPPIASLTATPVTGSAPLLVELDASASSDDGALTYQYNFGDGSPTLVTNVNRITHEYQAGSYTASVKVLDLQGLESNSAVEIQSLTPSPEDAPQINIVTKNAYDLYLNYLQGSPIELDATSSTGGNGEIVHYEWKKDDEVIGNGSSVALPSDSIGHYNYSLSITNSNKLTSKKTFVISISPNVSPAITVDQPNAYAPSDVSLSLVNTNDFVGIKSLTWSNKYTGEELSGGTFRQLLEHIGENTFQLKLEDTYGYVYEKNVIVTVLNDGPYIEGLSMIDVVLGGPQEFKYIVSKDLNTTVELKEQISGVTLNSFGELEFNLNEAPSGVEYITLIASNGLRFFEKEVKVNWLMPTFLATIPAGFYGTYTINAPNSILNKTQILITEDMINGPTTINFLEAKTTDGTYLVTKTEGGDLRNPIQITTSGSVLGAHLDGTLHKMFNPFEFIRKLTYDNTINNCKWNIFFKEFAFDDPRIKALPAKDYSTTGGLRVLTKGRNFTEQNLSGSQIKLIKNLAQTFDNRLDDKSKTIYIIDYEVMKLKGIPNNFDGFVSRYDKENIIINIDDLFHRRGSHGFSSEKEAIDFYSAVMHHEYRHTYQNLTLGCNMDTFERDASKFLFESEADHYMIKTSDPEERAAIFKYDSYKKYKASYLNFTLDTIEGSLDTNTNKDYALNFPYIFSPIWDMIDSEDFYGWMNEQFGKHSSSSNITILNDYLSPKTYPIFLMDYEYKTLFPSRTNDEIIRAIGSASFVSENDISSSKAIKRYEEIILQSSSANLRVITKNYLKNNNMYNADGFAFLEIAFDDTIGIHARMENDLENGYFLLGESGYSNESEEDDEEEDEGENDSKIIRLYENSCDQCELVLANVASKEQGITVTTYGATKIVNDEDNFEPRLNESSTDDPWTQWPNILIKHYYPWEDEAAYSWVDPGNDLYVNHLKPVHVYMCTPKDFEKGDDGTIRDFSYDCGWHELSLSIENNYKITLKNCFTPLFEGDVHVGFTANGTETCHYETSIIPSGETAVVKGSNPLKSFLKSLSDIFAPRAYAHMHLIPTRPNPEVLFGIKTEKKRQMRQ